MGDDDEEDSEASSATSSTDAQEYDIVEAVEHALFGDSKSK